MRFHAQSCMSGAIRTAASANLLVVVGSDRGLIVSKEGRRGHVGNTDVFRLLGENARFDEFHLGKNLRQLPWIPDLAPYSCILNLISDPDQNPRTLDNLRKLLRGFRGTVINRPEDVLCSGRDQMAALLTGTAGLTVPRTIRLRTAKPNAAARAVERAGLQFPVILRVAGTHMGKIIGLMQDLDGLQESLSPGAEHIVTEFVDFRSPDGLYRKYRVFFLGQKRIFRHLIGADNWNIHARERFAFMAHHPGLIAEEKQILEQPPGVFPAGVAATLDAVRERIALDYFGMDFGIAANGQLVLFEANATMNFFPVRNEPPFAHIERVLHPAQQAFREELGSAVGQGSPP